jgi:hypothetical protein
MAIFMDSPVEVEIVGSEAGEIHVLVESRCGAYKRFFSPFSSVGAHLGVLSSQAALKKF